MSSSLMIQQNENHMMIDIETLSKDYNALIVSVGFVVFNMEGEVVSGIYELNWRDQILKRRKVCEGTIDWWISKKIRLPYGACDIADFFKIICNSSQENNVSYFWFRGPQFDAVKLESLAKDFGCEVPWNYKQVRDCRTFDLFRDPNMKVFEAAHNALEDARKQAKELIHTLNYIGQTI